MEGDGGVKAPVTRLRRRLSVELSEESKSPGPATPTKKRGGRLAAKPQLELIDENTSQNSPKKTTRRRSTARDIADMDEKPLTPSRRSTRIKSNTSILSDTPQAVDSPRAKRALRRNSLLGSDTETPTPVTPARTRRARVDSTTSLDKQATSASGTPVIPARIGRTRKDSESNLNKSVETEDGSRTSLITKVIAEEPENNQRKSIAEGESPCEKKFADSPDSPRKSPRLLAKKNRKSNVDNKQSQSPLQDPDINMNISANKSKLDGSILESGDVEIAQESKQEDLSDGTSQFRTASVLNNKGEELHKTLISESTLLLSQIPCDLKAKRHRTKSWTTLSSSSPKEGSFYSDNESTKKKIKNKAKSFNTKLATKDIKKTNQSQVQDKTDTEKHSNNSMNKKMKRCSQNSESDKSMKESILNQLNNYNSSMVQSPKSSNKTPDGNKENLSDQTSKDPAKYLFHKKLSSSIQSMLVIEDSDTDSLEKIKRSAETKNQDQCVPEVEQVTNINFPKESESNIMNTPTDNQLFSSLKATTNNDTCEPMDIDETMPENVSLKDHLGGNKSMDNSKNNSLKESSLINSHDKSANKSINKYQRKSSLSISMTQDHEATDNGNKSTLILSQIKDLSTGIQDNSKASNDSRQVNESKSLKEKETNLKIINKNISMSCLTSTPVQQNDNKKLPMQMNTSAITPPNEIKKILIEKKKSLSKVSNSSQPDSSEESDDGSEHNSLVIDEAEETGDNYESGDSQDDEERQYERDHEIVDKGVTLTSDDEVSNDSDYEKDSFVVSSNEEDNELLSGSGEDLDMSDNELTMSAKSKKKYNDRLTKQQKKASREIFQARHGLDKTEKSNGSKISKINRQRLDSLLLESSDDAVVPPKKKKRMRLESTMDSSAAKSDAEEPNETLEVEEIRSKKKKNKCFSESVSQPDNEIDIPGFKNQASYQDKSVSEEIGHKKKKTKRLSQSVCDENVMNEKEITAICDTTIADDPLHLQIKQEPKTPQLDLDISTVHFSVREEIEQVQVNNDSSIMKRNETSDPLQISMVQEGNDEDSDDDNSSISEYEEITKNYESILNELNKDTKSKIKSVDISLNLNNKAKQKPKQTIFDQLNITQTKKPKSGKTETTSSTIFDTPKDDDTSSDSVDLNLLFSDDSNPGVKETSIVKNNTEIEDNILSPEITKGNTNLSMNSNAGQVQANNSISLNTSKKKNKCKSVKQDTPVIDGTTLPFFIDTVGTCNELLNNSESKIKIKNTKISVGSHCKDGIEDDSKAYDNAPAKVVDTSLKKKNKFKKLSQNFEKDVTNETESNVMLINQIIESPDMDMEKKRKKTEQDIKPGKELFITETYDKSVTDHKAAIESIQGVCNKKENKKRKRLPSANEFDDLKSKGNIPTTNKLDHMNESIVGNSKKKRKVELNDIGDKSRKRKERDDDVQFMKSKVLKQNSSEKKQVPRLPSAILDQLKDKSKLLCQTKSPKIVSTTEFKVEETRIRRNKPSNFLEESIYLNTDPESPNIKKQKLKVRKPVVLPFMPTASISDSGFTTKFHITPIPQKVEFVAQKIETTNYKTDYLNARRSKKIRTYDLYKNRRNVNLSKY